MFTSEKLREFFRNIFENASFYFLKYSTKYDGVQGAGRKNLCNRLHFRS